MEVRLDNLSKHFPGVKGAPTVKAVDQMNFTIPDGKLVGLLGPSGCGKSTTLYKMCIRDRCRGYYFVTLLSYLLTY